MAASRRTLIGIRVVTRREERGGEVMAKTMTMTEVRVKGEGIAIIPHGELLNLFKEEQVEAVYKYGVFDREAQGRVKDVHDLTKGPYKGYDSTRPRASSVISSQNVDRDGDTVHSGGMVLSDAYMKNPIVLPMHSREFPVGMTRKIKQLAKSIAAEWEWLVDQEYTQASVFQQAWDAYVLNSTSIGFLPIELEANYGSWGIGYLEWELLEFSPVIIPAHQDAMRTDGLKSLMKAFGEAVMDGPSPIAKRLWEEALAKVSPKQIAIGYHETDFAPAEPGNSTTEVYTPVDADKVEREVLRSIAEKLGLDPVETTIGGEHLIILDGKGWPEDTKGVIPYKKTAKAPEDEAWDGPKEVAAAEVSDLKTMCTWVDSEDTDSKGSYKLPHHKADGHAVVWKGVSAAMGALLGARGGVDVPDDDRKGIYSHLAKHYAEFDKEPPEFKEAEIATVDDALGAFVAGTLNREEAKKLIEGWLGDERAKADQYKREAEDIAARVIRRR